MLPQHEEMLRLRDLDELNLIYFFSKNQSLLPASANKKVYFGQSGSIMVPLVISVLSATFVPLERFQRFANQRLRIGTRVSLGIFLWIVTGMAFLPSQQDIKTEMQSMHAKIDKFAVTGDIQQFINS